MKHAGAEALAELAGLREELALLDGLREKSPGSFYRSGRSLLHFHEDPSGLCADVRFPGDEDYTRLPVSQPAERQALVTELRVSLAKPAGPGA